MSFEDIQKMRNLEQRIAILEELVKQMQLATKKQTLSLPVREPKPKSN